MEDLNPRILDFFTSSYKPGIIGMVGAKDFIGLGIREAQRAVTTDGKASLWSHCFILGELRFDRRGTGGTKSKSPYLFESDLNINLFEPQLRNGAQENWIGKWCKEKVEIAALIRGTATKKWGKTFSAMRSVFRTRLQKILPRPELRQGP